MNQEPNFEPLDRRDDAWLEGVLSFDARSPHHSEDPDFVASVMAELPTKHNFYTPELARHFLAGTALSIAAVVVVEKGQDLVASFGQAAVHLHPDQMITAVAPFVVLLGLVVMTFRMQRS